MVTPEFIFGVIGAVLLIFVVLCFAFGDGEG